ncbi:MAG: peptidylprolyl isomerase [Hyphomicrobiales bacterium]|nr:peptidylprolyl isomerase [Hyphomicrobiales bacterium]
MSFASFPRLAAVALAAVCLAPAAALANLQNTLYMQLKTGRVVIELRPDLAPKHVERIKKLARDGFYDGLKFHRVISGFMAQTGDPTGTGQGGSPLPNLPKEFSNAPFVRGSLGAARTMDENSANSQFFICFEEASHLNRKYTLFGQVVEGMEHVDKIKKGNAGDGTVLNPDVIVKMQVAADAR